MGIISDIKNKFSGMFGSSAGEEAILNEGEKEYVELDTATTEVAKGKIIVKPFVINDFNDIKGVLDTLREGATIALVNIKPLKDKDIIELKRVINKLKKTTDAIEGDIAGFGDDYIVVTPSFARISRSKTEQQQVKPVTEESI